MKKKVNLEEILVNHFNCYVSDIPNLESIKLAMKEACRQVLELATENAKMITVEGFFADDTFISSKSITDTIKQVK